MRLICHDVCVYMCTIESGVICIILLNVCRKREHFTLKITSHSLNAFKQNCQILFFWKRRILRQCQCLISFFFFLLFCLAFYIVQSFLWHVRIYPLHSISHASNQKTAKIKLPPLLFRINHPFFLLSTYSQV